MPDWIVCSVNELQRDGVIIGDVCQAALQYPEETNLIMVALNEWVLATIATWDHRIQESERAVADTRHQAMMQRDQMELAFSKQLLSMEQKLQQVQRMNNDDPYTSQYVGW